MASPPRSQFDARHPDQAEAIRNQLDRILASPPFRRADRLKQFLRFIVEKDLAGEAYLLKETYIGSTVYGRPVGYDPKIDAIVRTEARRLRGKLLVYEETSGSGDPLVIRLPVGGYAPTIEFRPAPAIPQITPRRFNKLNGLIAGVAAAIALVALGGWLSTFARHPRDPAITQVTSYAGFESSPSLSPDGKQVAFVWNGRDDNLDIYVKQLGTETPRRLTTSPAEDLNPAWSPDGGTIAFLRAYADGRTQVILLPVAGGPERVLTEIHPVRGPWRANSSATGRSLGPVWTPDSQHLVVSDRCETEGTSSDCLYLLSTNGRDVRRLTAAPPDSLGDKVPAVSPDGSQIAFVRVFSGREITELYVQSMRDPEARALTHDAKSILSVAWAGNRLFFISNRAGGNGVWTLPAGGGTPEPVTAAGLHAGPLDVTRDGRRLVYSESFLNTNVWRLDLSSPGGEPVKLLASSRQNDSAHYSPDGRKICFISDRTGTFQLWVANADGSNPAALTSFPPSTPVGSPRWSPGGDRIAFDSALNGHSVIYEVSIDGGGAPWLLENGNADNMMPTWSRDGRFVYFIRRQGGLRALWRKPAGGGVSERIVDGAYEDAQDSTDGKTLYFSTKDPGIRQAPAAGGEPVLIPELKDVVSSRYFAATDRGIYFVGSEKCPCQVSFFDFASRRVTPITVIRKPLVSRTPSLSISPDGRWLLYAQLDDSGSDLMQAEFN